MTILKNVVFNSQQRLPILLQTENSECGLVCLAMISAYYGHHISLLELRQKFSISIKGTTLNDLIHLSTKINLSARPLRVDLDEITQLRIPCIIHINMDHFVVLKEVTRKKIIVVDPAYGIRNYTHEEFSDIFTGIALELWPSSKFEEKKEIKSFRILGLLGELKNFIPPYIYLLILAIVLEVFNLLSPLYMQFLLDNVIPEGDEKLLVTLSLAFLMLLVFSIVVSVTQALLGLFVATTLSVQWKYNILQHLVNLPQDYFFKRHLGDILSRFNSIEPIQSTLTSTFIVTLINGFMALFTFGLMCYMNIKLALISLLSLLLYLAVRIIAFHPLKRLMEKGIIYSANQGTYLMETLRGMKVIKLFNKQNIRSKNWLSLYIYQVNNSITTQKYNLAFSIIYKLIFGIESIAILWLGALLVIEKSITIGFLVAFIAYKNQFASRFSSLIDSFIQIKMLDLHGERLSDIVLTDQDQDTSLQLSEQRKNEIQGKITVKNLTFKYGESDPEIIKNISFEIAPGQSVSLTGPSGEGKTTLMNLLNSSLTATEGDILIDDISLKQFGKNNVRSIIACVSQDDTLFAGNLYENISFFDDNIDQEWVEKCAKMSGIHDEILQMPMGYLSLVGDMGSSFSGGQKQRLFIARALYKNLKFYLWMKQLAI